MALPINSAVPKEKVEDGYLIKVIIGLVDAALAIGLFVLIGVYKTPPLIYELLAANNSTLLLLLWLIIYRFITITLFNGTVAMNLFNVILLNGEQQPVRIKEKILFSIFILYAGVNYYYK